MGMRKIFAGLFLVFLFKKTQTLKVKTMVLRRRVHTNVCKPKYVHFCSFFPPSPPFPCKITVCIFGLAVVKGRFAENLNIAVSCFSFNFLCFEILLFKC